MGYYCSATDVAEILGLSAWPSSGPITAAVIEKWITRTEDRVDLATSRSYKKQTSTEEYHDYYSVENRADTGVPVYLDHDQLYTFDSTKGDKIEIWNGSSYENLHNTGTVGRSADYWFDYEKGILFLRYGIRTIIRGVRVTYRYGNYTSVPGYIQDATALLVAARVATLDGTAAILASEGREVPNEEKIRLWTKEAHSVLDSQKGYRSVGALPGVLR